jgi:MFS family permease
MLADGAPPPPVQEYWALPEGACGSRERASVMTAIEASASRSDEKRTLTLISASHFVSHFYMLLLPPLFIALQGDLGWSYTEISFGIVAFYLTSTIFQTPAGYLADARTPRAVLIAGLCIEALAVGLAGMTSSLWMFVALFGVAGIGNTVFHPAHYAIMSHRIGAKNIGGAYAVHTFAGFLGTAAAPVTLLTLSSMFGWRGALFASAAAGLVMAAVLLANARYLRGLDSPAVAADSVASARGKSAVLMRPEIILNLVIFGFLAAGNSGVQGYVVAALVEAWGTPLTAANAAVSAFLVANALGVLLGGIASRHVPSQALLFCAGLCVVASSISVLAVADLGAVGLMAVLTLGGLANGIILPSRDLMVRAVTPDGQYGLVFGFVSTGFFIGASIAPLALALFLDHGRPGWVFALIAAFNLCCVALAAGMALKRRG